MDYSTSLTGNSIVDEISRLHLLTIPQAWYKTIRQKNAPHALAILILQDLIYWYTWTEVRSEETGAVIAYKKKFKADLLQRSYEQLAERFGITKRQAYDVIFFLQQLGVLTRVFRTVNIGGIKCNNVLFIQLHPDKIREISDERNNIESNANTDSVEDPRNSTTASHENLQQALPKSCNTNTNITTNITTNISHSSACACEPASESKELWGIGAKQKEFYTILEEYNKSAPQNKKIAISKGLITFVQRELRELFGTFTTATYDEAMIAIKNYLKVASSESWKTSFSWRNFVKEYLDYTPEYFDESKYAVRKPFVKNEPKPVSEEFKRKLEEDAYKASEKERVSKLREDFNSLTPPKRRAAEKIFEAYQQSSDVYSDYDFFAFSLEFAEVADKLKSIPSNVLLEQFSKYFEQCIALDTEPDDFKTIVNNGLISADNPEE